MNMIAKRTSAINRVVLPDGREMNPDRAKGLGYAIESLNEQAERNIAARQAKNAAMQIAGDAYDDGLAKSPAPVKTKASAMIAYAQAIEELPEAKTRRAAASELWSKHTVETMPLERAASFLRGLPPEENAPVVTAAHSAVDPKKLAKFQRLAELQVLGLTVKAERGDLGARKEASKLSWALRVRSETGCAFGEAFASVGLDARATVETIMKMGV
jgi:hypothetical protein